MDLSRARISAVLITREPDYPQDALPDFPFDEILIQTNCPSLMRRWDLVEEANNDIIYVQDDDVKVDVKALWNIYKLSPDFLTCVITPMHFERYMGTGTTLVGWGCFFQKKQVNFQPWIDVFGPVPERECDLVMTYFAQPFNHIVQPVHEFARSRPERMCSAPDHYTRRQDVMRQLQTLGPVLQEGAGLYLQ